MEKNKSIGVAGAIAGYPVRKSCSNHSDFEITSKPVSKTISIYKKQTENGSLCYTQGKKENFMSLVGIMKNKNGMVAFADEKSTYCIGNTNYGSDNVKKVFQGRNFIFVTAGNNEVYIRHNKIPLEDIIDSLDPKSYNNYEEFFEDFSDYLTKNNAFHYASEYYFIAGTFHEYTYHKKNYKSYYIVEVFVRDHDVSYTKSYHDTIRYNGFVDFMPRTIVVKEDWTLEELEKYAKHLVADSIFYAELIHGKNSTIGGEAQILSMSLS